MSYNTSNYRQQGGAVDVIGGELRVVTGGKITPNSGTQASAIADLTTTATTGTLPTANGTVTIANAASPTVAELLEYCVELEAKLEAALAALRGVGIIAS